MLGTNAKAQTFLNQRKPKPEKKNIISDEQCLTS
jgi:hypothetical protein